MSTSPTVLETASSWARRLARRQGEAADTPAPAVIAPRIERVERQVDALLWSGFTVGLLFATVDVQSPA